MRILYLFSSAETSVAKVTLNQIKALRKYYPKLDVKIACVNYYRERSVLEDEIIIKKLLNKNQISNYISSLLFIKRVKKDFKPDVTVSNLSAVNSYNILSGGNEVKIGIFHSPVIQFKQKNFLARVLNEFSLKNIFPKLDAVVGISQEVVDDLSRNIPSNDIRLHYNIHDKDEIIRKSSDQSLYDIKSEKRTKILCLGTIDRNKRQELIIKALAKKNDPSLVIYIVGKVIEESYYEELCKLIEFYNIKKQVVFIEFLENPYPLIKNMDMLISVSESEGLPGVVIESLLLNVPVVCSNSSKGIWEILNVKDIYDQFLDRIFYTEKGVIIPNPKDIQEEVILKHLIDAITKITTDKEKFKERNFAFAEMITDKSIHLFYNLIEEKIYENNN